MAKILNACNLFYGIPHYNWFFIPIKNTHFKFLSLDFGNSNSVFSVECNDNNDDILKQLTVKQNDWIKNRLAALINKFIVNYKKR